MRKNILKTFRVSLFLILIVISTQLSFAQAAVSKEQYVQRLEQWKKLSPEERKTILANYKKYKKLSEQEKEIIKQNYQEWQILPEPEKQKVKIEVRNFEKLPRPQQERIFKEKRLGGQIKEQVRTELKGKPVFRKENRGIEKKKNIEPHKQLERMDEQKVRAVRPLDENRPQEKITHSDGIKQQEHLKPVKKENENIKKTHPVKGKILKENKKRKNN